MQREKFPLHTLIFLFLKIEKWFYFIILIQIKTTNMKIYLSLLPSLTDDSIRYEY